MRSSPVVASVVAAALLTSQPTAAQDSGPPSPDPGEFGLAMTRLELTLDLDYEEGSLAGWADYEITNLSDSPVHTVPFNLGRLMAVGAATGPDGEQLRFEQDVKVFEDSPRRQVNHVRVTLAEPLGMGATLTLRLQYHGFLVGYTETGSIYIKDRIHEDFSILREDALAWPSLGTLSRRSNRVAPRPDFEFAARITVPEGITVASSGRLLEVQTVAGRTTFSYQSDAPAPFLNIPIAKYEVLERAGVRVYHFPEDSVGARRVLDGAEAGLDLLANWFGPLGIEPDLAVMEIPEMWGSQASLRGGIIQTADAFRDAGRMSQLYHELTHLWNAPDLDEPSARWNEGLATFLSRRMATELDGWDGWQEDLRRVSTSLLDAAERNRAVSTVPFIDYGEAGTTGLSYRVGYLMFYSLHRALGSDGFDAALAGYYQDHKHSGGTFEGLIERVQAQSELDLSRFFSEWVYTTAWFDHLAGGERLEDIGFGLERE